MLSGKKICFLGAGAMAEALIKGLLEQKVVEPGQIFVVNKKNKQRAEKLAAQFGICPSTGEYQQPLREADIVILAVKPMDVKNVLLAVKEWIREEQLLLSVVAGLSTSAITHLLGIEIPVIRTMPNTSASIGHSATGISIGTHAQGQHVQLAKTIFSSIGTVLLIDEDKMDAVTGLAGSGPAYIYYMVEAMIKGGMDVGLTEEEARQLTIQTVLGAAIMLSQTGSDPAHLREKVTSPKGTTARGIETLQTHHFQQAVRQCIRQATERSKELGREM